MAQGGDVLVAVSTASPVPGSTEDIVIRGISSQGAGVGALADGRTVFVPRAAPGEVVRARLERVRPRWATGTLVDVLRPSADRRPALCPVYDRCGGCQLQHVPEEVQRRVKAELVVEALDRIGGLGRIDAPPVEPSPEPVRYRSRMSFTLRRLGGGRVVAGLHALGRPGHVVDIHDECVLPEPPVARAWLRLRERWGPGAALLPAGDPLRLTIRSSAGGPTLLVEGGARGWSAGPLARALPELVDVTHRPAGAGGKAAGGHFQDREAPAGKAPAREAPAHELSGRDAPAGKAPGSEALVAHEPGTGGPLVGAFEQVNRAAAALLRDRVVARAGRPGRAVDAYCGTGLHGRALAERGWTVVGLELDAEAAAAARADTPDGFAVRTGPVERLLPAELPADLLVVNPPRAGLSPEVVAHILAAPPARLIYVSCDPATLARDLGRLGECYALEDVHAFDLFPQTAHVETVVVLCSAPHPQDNEKVS